MAAVGTNHQPMKPSDRSRAICTYAQGMILQVQLEMRLGFHIWFGNLLRGLAVPRRGRMKADGNSYIGEKNGEMGRAISVP
jgi:hypothetical protein